jgi:Holliday junction resolvase
MINSRQKGASGERELANILRKEYGFECRRGQQFCGKNGDADVIGLPYMHIEVKRVEKLNIDDALAQANRDRRAGKIPAVFHRKNRTKWKVTLDLQDFMIIYGEYFSSLALAGIEDEE